MRKPMQVVNSLLLPRSTSNSKELYYIDQHIGSFCHRQGARLGRLRQLEQNFPQNYHGEHCDEL